MTMSNYTRKIIFVFIVIISMSPSVVHAQPARLYGDRLLSKDGRWLLPVATLHLGSDEKDHLSRGSVQAWDLVAPLNSVVFPIADGKVEYAGCDNKGGYGCWLYIRHETGIHTIMGHCVKGSILVKNGDQVTQWTPVCKTGMTGMTSYGPHIYLEIHKPGGGRYDIAQFWDKNAMTYEKLGNTHSNEAITQIGVVTASGQRVPVNINGQVAQEKQEPAQEPVKLDAKPAKPVNFLAGLLYAMGENPIIGIVFVGLILINLFTNFKRTALAGAAVTILFFVYTAQPVKTAQSIAEVIEPEHEYTDAETANAFNTAYKLLSKPGFEGRSCTVDPVKTFAGTTQAAFDNYRRRHGLPLADVCTSLTDKEHKEIAYEDYWVKSGADQIAKDDIPLAISHFDFAYNAGPGKGGAPWNILQQCKGVFEAVKCYNDARERWYRGRQAFSVYGAGWVNRVNKLRKIVAEMK